MSVQLEANAGLVTIRRTKGRIPGFAGSPCGVPSEILWCGVNRPRKKFGNRRNGWSFPPAVEETLLQACKGETLLHLFGGLARFGYRLDLDPKVNPDYLGDAFLAAKYFSRDSFDHVVLDPPYLICQRCFERQTLANGRKPDTQPAKVKQEILCLLDTAAWLARKNIWWFSTLAINSTVVTPLEKIWAVYCGGQCSMRVLQKFSVLEPKRKPPDFSDFVRGPAVKYQRWGNGTEPILFPGVDYSGLGLGASR